MSDEMAANREFAAISSDMNRTEARQLQGQHTGWQFAAESDLETRVVLRAGTQLVRIVFPDGTEKWYQHDELHRDDGPAITWSGGTREWWQHGKRHRDGGPATIWPDGTELWYQHGELHRDGGPATIWPSGTEEWWQHGERIDPPIPNLPPSHQT